MGRIEWEGGHASDCGHIDRNILFEFGTATPVGIEVHDTHRVSQPQGSSCSFKSVIQQSILDLHRSCFGRCYIERLAFIEEVSTDMREARFEKF